MKVVAFNGSPRKDGNTATLINYLFGTLEKAGIETEVVQLKAAEIHGCLACNKCFDHRDGRCVQKDAANLYIEKMMAAQGIVLASPSYFQDVTAEMKALVDRVGYVGLANGRMFKNKVGAALCCFRRTGGMHTIETMNHLFFSNEFVIAGRALGQARDIGDMKRDEEGIQMAESLGQRMAWILNRLHG